ncbi:Peptidase [Geitlerinema sp. FC II]|nr:M48 family metalloprotease [Geitlerinema sp. CS-897]PPT09847.1 Peptidase [Geitlerinema sp. FC II]
MKRLRNLLCFLLGTAFFLSLNLFLPNIPLFLRGVVAATPSAQAPQFYPRKSISLKTYPVSEVATEKSQKALNRDRPESNTEHLAQRQIFQENGSLDNSDDVLRDRSRFDLYSFDGRAGQEIRIQLESRDFDTYLILLGPDDRPLGENDDRARNDPNAELTVTLPRTGTYRIVANAFDARGRGRYTLTVYDLGATSPTASKPDPARVSAPSSGSVSLTREEELLARGDRLYLEGNIAEAQRLYRQVKPPFPREGELQVVEPITEEELSPAARVYWDNVRDGLANDRETQVESSLELLLQEAPGFAPAYKLIAEALLEDDRTEEAIVVLEDATTQFPQSYELARLLAETLRDDGQRLEAAIVAREFAIVNPDHPESEEILELSDRYLRSFRRKLRENIALRGLGGLAVGVLTGRTTSTIFQAINLAQLMVAGESRLGEQVAAQVRQELPMLDDPEVLSYVNDIGQEVAQYMGRDEFDYEFYVVRDDTLNAFALPGGKVFVHTGAIQAARSEAELAGLLGHEVGHAVLSHGFQRIVTNNLLSNLAREIPFGDLLGTLVSLDYSRKHERQSDILGTRVINSAGYAADGLRNFMETLRQEQRGPVIPYLSTHPAPASRVRYMEELIQRNGYERYAFEGVERLAAVKARL